jgi:hypothetical protein
MSSRVNSHDLPGQGLSVANISVVGSKVPQSLKTTIHDSFSFRYHTNKIHAQRSVIPRKPEEFQIFIVAASFASFTQQYWFWLTFDLRNVIIHFKFRNNGVENSTIISVLG